MTAAYRMGFVHGGYLGFDSNHARPDPLMLNPFEYAVIEDCTTDPGLIGPVDTENTKEAVVVQDLRGANFANFWQTRAKLVLRL